MKTSSREPDQLKKGRTRAGKRKCTRCKGIFHRNKEETSIVCPECKNHCSRCHSVLSENNYDYKYKRGWCKPCTREVIKLTGDKSKKKDWNLTRNFGITLPEYEAILQLQNGICWICHQPPVNIRLAVDHKHEKGEKKRNPREIRGRVRGLLCWGCNNAIAKLRDDPVRARRAAEYLEKWPAQEILKNV